MRLVLCGILIVLVAIPAAAQRSWLIAPGQGWGPIKLDQSVQDVVNVLGQPTRTVGGGYSTFTTRLYYPGATVWFGPSGLATTILINDYTSVTRESVRIGSSIMAVLTAYGDTAANRSNDFKDCLRISANGPPDYQTPRLVFNYLQRGVGFEFVDGKVSLIIVSHPTACGG